MKKTKFKNNSFKTLKFPLDCRASLAAMASLLLVSNSASAASASWNVNTDGAWATGSNWTGAAAPGVNTGTIVSPDVATFGTVITAGHIVTVDANRNVSDINFAANSSAYTLSGGNLLLTALGTLQTSGAGTAHTDAVNSAVTLGGDYTFATNSTTVGRILSIGTTVTSAATSGTTTLTLDGIGTSANNAVTGIISNGTGTNKVAITKNGAGSWTLSGANTYTGDVTVNAGTVRAVNTANTNVLNALGTGNTVNLNGGTLNLLANGTGNNQTIVASNSITTGNAATTINVNNNGTTNQNIISLTNLSAGTGQVNIGGGNLFILKFTGGTTLTGNATFNTTTAGLNLGGVISGGFGFSKLGVASAQNIFGSNGVMTVSGANTYTGVTSVLEGFLVLNGAAPVGAAGTLGIGTSAVLVGNTTGSVNAGLLINNVVVDRDITIQSGNTGTAFLASNTNSASPATFNGAITLGSSGAAGHGVTLATGGTHTTIFNGTIQDNAGLVGTAGVVTIGDVTTANALTTVFSPNSTNGSSNIIIAGANTYSGGTVIDTTGSIRIANANAFGTGNLSIVRGSIQGNGTSTLSGISSQTWDGNFTLNSFVFGTQGAVNLGTSAVTLTGNRIISVVNNASVVGGVISGSGRSLQLNGSGTTASSLVLNGVNTFDGGLIVAAASGSTLTAVSGSSSGLGAGQLNLTNSTNSRASLNADTTVGSLTSSINNSISSFTAGTSALTAGTYALTITGGGTGASGTATVNSSGAVTAVSITGLGTNYTSAPTITLAGSTATFTPQAFGASSINLNPGTARTLTLSGNNASPASFAGVISGTGGSLVKNGAGTQALYGASTYTGGTTINGGKLLANNSTGSATGTGTVLVQSTATLGGGNGAAFAGTTSSLGSATLVNYDSNIVGMVANITTVASGGHIAPGNSVGTLTLSALTLNSGAILDYEFNLTANDLTTINGIGGLNFGSVGLNIYQEGTTTDFATAGLYNIFDYDTSYTGSLANLSVLNQTGGFTYSFVDNTTDGVIQLQIAAVPEPSTYALLGVGLSALWVLRRRKRA